MMSQALFADAVDDILDRLPQVRGRITPNADIAGTTWFRVGGPAQVLFRPEDFDDLAQFLAGCPEDIPITVLGVCSNIIIRDGGIPGVVIRLGRSFAEIDHDPETGLITAGAAALDMNVARYAAREGRGGLEFLSGIPGTIGGALRMNAGAYGAETVDVLAECTVLDRNGHTRQYKPDQMDMTYRHTGIPENFIFTQAVFKTIRENPDEVNRRIDEIRDKRTESQPVKARTGGSTFANPSVQDLRNAGLPEDMKTWQLIDGVQGRGFKIGGAMMSEKHCNFIINNGDATAADIEALGEEMRRRVLEKFGITLRWEIKRIGVEKSDFCADTKARGTA